MERTIERCGRLLFWCSHFAAYILPDRCKSERRIGRGVIAKGFTVGSKRRARLRPGIADAETAISDADFQDVVKRRKACLSCPGVCERSMSEFRAGELDV